MVEHLTTDSPFEAEFGYSRAVVDEHYVFVSGTTGYDYATMQIDDNVAVQADQCFRNIATVLARAGATLDDVVRVRYLVTDPAYAEPCAAVFRQHLARARPAATLMVVQLLDPAMKIEIEVTARRGT